MTVLSDRDLLMWAGNSLNVIGECLESTDDYAVDEAERGAEGLLAVIREIKARRPAP